MWNLPRPGFEPVSPALVGRFLTTTLPWKSHILCFWSITDRESLRSFYVNILTYLKLLVSPLLWFWHLFPSLKFSDFPFCLVFCVILLCYPRGKWNGLYHQFILFSGKYMCNYSLYSIPIPLVFKLSKQLWWLQYFFTLT